MKSVFLLSAVLVARISAQVEPVDGVGGGIGYPYSSGAAEIYEAAGRQPNASDTLSFARTFDDNEETWTWRINVSEIATPNDKNDLGTPSANASEGLRFAHTQWSLEWPDGSENLHSWLADRNSTLSILAMQLFKTPNITENYNERDDGDCTAIMGALCVQTLHNIASSPGRYTNVELLSGCENVTNFSWPGSEGGASIGQEIDGTTPEDSEAIRRGDSLVYFSSGDYAANNTTPLVRAKQALHVMVMNLRTANTSLAERSPGSVLCRIVESATSPSDSSSDDMADDTSDGAADGLHVWNALMGVVFLVVVFSVL